MDYFVIVEPFDTVKDNGYALYYDNIAHPDDILCNILEWVEFDCCVTLYTYSPTFGRDLELTYKTKAHVIEGSTWYYCY